MEYQIQKLTNAADGAAAQDKAPGAKVNGKGGQQGEGDLLGYRPNPDMMDIKIAPEGQLEFSLTNWCFLLYVLRW